MPNSRGQWTVVIAAIIGATVVAARPVGAQVLGGWQALPSIAPGTSITVRTSEPIDAAIVDGRVFSGVVDQDVLDTNERLAIPQGSTVELIVRKTASNNLSIDLDSVVVNGQRYAILADPSAVGTAGTVRSGLETLGANQKTAEFVGGGALLGTVIGAIAGGASGAAIGAATGAAAGAGAQIATQGSSVRVPAESLLTFRLERALTVGVPDNGYMRDGHHFHAF